MFSKEGEVVTRQVYENVRLDHLLSKEPKCVISDFWCYVISFIVMYYLSHKVIKREEKTLKSFFINFF